MKINRNTLAILSLIAVATMAVPVKLSAATNGFVVPPFRGAANSQSGYWENFTVPVGAPGNLPDQPGATTSAVLTQTNPGAILASGNIYNPATSNAFVIADAPPFVPATVVLQARTVGNALDYNSATLNYSDASGAHSVAPLFRYELSVADGGVSSLWQWDLTGLNVTSYTISFNGSGPHVSLDAVTLDTAGQFSAAFPQQPFKLQSQVAGLARWDYLASDFGLQTRATASVFGALGDAPDFDARDAQYLLGWNTTNRVPAGQGAKNYLVRRVRVTLTVSSAGQYVYTGKLRDYRTYLPATDPNYLPSASATCPVELFGAGFRGGFLNNASVYVPWAATNYPQTGPWSTNANAYYADRVAFAAGFDTNGILVDVSNNVGDDGTNEMPGPFEVAPFAVGQTTNVVEGQVLPVNSRLTFDLNLDDPLIYSYVQNGLNAGNLSFIACSLIVASQSGPQTYPAFYTIFSSIASTDQFPLLDIEGEIVRPNVDNDGDGLPDDWENFYFGALGQGATNDADGDGVSNLAEYQAGTNPTNAASGFRVLSLQRPADAAELRFTFAPNRQYSVQWASDLKNWQTVTNPLLNYSSAWLAKTGTNLVYPSPVYTTWRDTNAAGPQRFYRVGAQ
jgi:hypothetical protein